MSLASQIQSDFAHFTDLTDEFAKSATYTKYSDATTLDVSVITETLNMHDIHDNNRSINDNSIMFISLDFKPAIYDTITINSDVWKIDSFLEIAQNSYRVEVSKGDRDAHSHSHGRFR